ncbi:MAG: hypothetical protein GM43_1275 [actinobacterium acMicro-4]|nr:MAG: hypothetical protein GM43_1275 [actinobacterium acMicro-4]
MKGSDDCPVSLGPGAWHSRDVTDQIDAVWLTVPEVCERLGLTPGKVHRLVEDRALLGTKIEGIFRIPEVFLDGGEPLKDLRGTVVVLLDGGFTDDDATRWLLEHNDALAVAPIDALRSGRKSEVRRLAQTLAL